MRFGGVASRAALSVIDTMHGTVIRVNRGTAGQPASAVVRVTATGKVISGVVYARPIDGPTEDLANTSVTCTRVGGRWVVL